MEEGIEFVKRRTCNKIRNWEKRNTPVWCVPKGLQWLSWNEIQLKYITKEFNLRIVFGIRIIYLSPSGLCGFYSPYLYCLSEHLHLRDMEPLVLMAGFYCLPTTTHPLMLVCYSLAVLGIKCLLWLLPSLIFVHYDLHWIAFNSFGERWTILTLISNECRGVIDFSGTFLIGVSIMLLPI